MGHTVIRSAFYRPQLSCLQGNVFTPVCHSVHRGVYPSTHLGHMTNHHYITQGLVDRHPPGTMPSQTPHQADPPPGHPCPHRHPARQTPPWADTPSWADTPPGWTPPGQNPSPPQPDTPPPGQTPFLDRQPSPPPYTPIRPLLLECIFVQRICGGFFHLFSPASAFWRKCTF